MKKIIKFEDLYQPIKTEVKKYYKNKKALNNELQLKDATDMWFYNEFEGWMDEHATKSDRRYEHERRNHNVLMATENRGGEVRRKVLRRKKMRFNIELPVKAVETVRKASSNASVIKKYLGRSENVKDGGLYFKSKVPLAVSSIIRVVLDFSKIDKGFKNIVANAMVVKVTKLSNGKYWISMMFSKINEKNGANLNTQIFKSLAFHKNDLYTMFSMS